ncbi:YfiR family protein [Flavobacteriales bacterium AH-315-E23]|nr:YfiR family protein [Flavobacteriales bacterium AH-315-E23]
MKALYKIPVILLFLISSGFTPVQTNDNTNAKIKATFIYNFTRYIEWPAEAKKGNFEIGVLGNTPLYAELIEMQRKTTRGAQPFLIKKYLSVSSIGKCHMIFISKANSGEMDAIVKKFKGKSTLIISEKPGLIEKGDINFVVTNNKQGFEINRGNIAGHSLSIASSLQAFATKVI